MPLEERIPDPRDTRRNELVGLHHRLHTPACAIVDYSRTLFESAPEPVAAQMKRIKDAAEDLMDRLNGLVAVDRLDEAFIERDPAGFNCELKHELATSLHVILGSCEIIKDHSSEGEPSVAEEDIDRIVDATNRLLSSIDAATSKSDVTALSRPAPGPEPVVPAASMAHSRTNGETRSDVVSAAPPGAPARVLVVDDDELNRELLVRHLHRQSLRSSVACDGIEALRLLAEEAFDLVLLDIVMPELDGFGVLSRMREDPALRHVPVLVISAMDDMESVVRCIELGAEDHLPKAFNKTLFDARVRAVLERKRLHDEAAVRIEQLRLERQRSDDLLLAVLPDVIAKRLKLGETTIADGFDAVTVTFCDIVGFTGLTTRTPPRELVARLNSLVTSFDGIAERFGVEKLKTIGDSYMIVSGVPRPRSDHAVAAARAALAMLEQVEEHNRRYADPLQVRIGMHSGPVVAGVIGRKRFVYDVWGDTVNVASRMESQGLRGRIQISQATYELLRGHFELQPRGQIRIRGKGSVSTYLLLDPAS